METNCTKTQISYTVRNFTADDEDRAIELKKSIIPT